MLGVRDAALQYLSRPKGGSTVPDTWVFAGTAIPHGQAAFEIYCVCEREELQVTASVRESICRLNTTYLCLFMEVEFEVRPAFEAPRQSVSPFSVAEVKQHCNSCAPTNTFFP